MINRKAVLIKKTVRSIVWDVLLFIVLVFAVIGTPVQAFVVGGGMEGVYEIVAQRPQIVITLAIVVWIIINIFKQIILCIEHTMRVVEFLDNHNNCNTADPTIYINKHVEVVGNYIIIMSKVPYVIDINKASRFAIAEQKIRIFFKYYTIEFIDERGQCISVLFPVTRKKYEEIAELMEYLNKLNKLQEV